jgi:hyaluronate lyase
LRAEAHAVRHKELKLIGVNFWQDRIKKVGPVCTSGKAAVMLQEQETELILSVADPTQLNQGNLVIELDFAAEKVIEMSEQIAVERLEPTVILSVDMRGTMGRALQARLEKLSR